MARDVFNICIFCHRIHEDRTVEHIVPRTLGNLHYILGQGAVCGRCNNRFARFEKEVVTSDTFLEERRRMGLLRPGYEQTSVNLQVSDMVRFLSKMAYESLYRSKRKQWKTLDLDHIRKFLVSGVESERIGSVNTDLEIEYKDIPGWIERFRLRNNQLRLEYSTGGPAVYFRFTFGRITAEIKIA